MFEYFCHGFCEAVLAFMKERDPQVQGISPATLEMLRADCLEFLTARREAELAILNVSPEDSGWDYFETLYSRGDGFCRECYVHHGPLLVNIASMFQPRVFAVVDGLVEDWGSLVLDEFRAGYLEAALFASHDMNEEPLGEGDTLDALYGPDDFSSAALADITGDCLGFLSLASQNNDAVEAIQAAPRQTGRDFFFTRCRHGAGFWDGDWPSSVGRFLTDWAHTFGDASFRVNDDGQIEVV
jgi:hypothetical protein